MLYWDLGLRIDEKKIECLHSTVVIESMYTHLSVIQGEYLRHAAIDTTHMGHVNCFLEKKKYKSNA